MTTVVPRMPRRTPGTGSRHMALTAREVVDIFTRSRIAFGAMRPSASTTVSSAWTRGNRPIDSMPRGPSSGDSRSTNSPRPIGPTRNNSPARSLPRSTHSALSGRTSTARMNQRSTGSRAASRAGTPRYCFYLRNFDHVVSSNDSDPDIRITLHHVNQGTGLRAPAGDLAGGPGD